MVKNFANEEEKRRTKKTAKKKPESEKLAAQETAKTDLPIEAQVQPQTDNIKPEEQSDESKFAEEARRRSLTWRKHGLDKFDTGPSDFDTQPHYGFGD